MTRTTGLHLLTVAVLLALPWKGTAAQPSATFVLRVFLDGRLPALVLAKPLMPEPGDDALRKLLKERYNAALREVKACYLQCLCGLRCFPPENSMRDAAFRALETRLELSDHPEERIRVRQEQLEWAADHERAVTRQHEAGRVSDIDVARVQYLRLDAEIKLLLAKREAAAGKPR